MIITRQGLLSEHGQRFDDSSRPSLPSVAEPSWFAPPIDVRQDDRSVTLVFRVDERVRVEARDSSLIVWGGRRDGRRAAVRVFSLPFPIDPETVESARAGDLLNVQVAKIHGKRARDLPPAAA